MPDYNDAPNAEPNPDSKLEFVTLPDPVPPPLNVSGLRKRERRMLWSALTLGVIALVVSLASYREARQATQMAFAVGRPFIQITAARVRGVPKIGGRATAELRFENVGVREAIDLKIWLQVTGRPADVTRQSGAPIIQKIEASIPSSGAGWVTVYSYNLWEQSDAVKDLSIGGVLMYADAAGSPGSFRQSFCFTTGTSAAAAGSELVSCSAVPALNPWRLFLEKS